jgi:hypothetical protein
MPGIVILIANIVDILVGVLTKHPEYEPHLGPVIAGLIPVLSQAAGETPEQTAARRAANDAVIAQYANAPLPPIVPVPVPTPHPNPTPSPVPGPGIG